MTLNLDDISEESPLPFNADGDNPLDGLVLANLPPPPTDFPFTKPTACVLLTAKTACCKIGIRGSLESKSLIALIKAFL